MPGTGGGPGKDPPDDTGPSKEEKVEDMSVGSNPGVSVDVFRHKIIDGFMATRRTVENRLEG